MAAAILLVALALILYRVAAFSLEYLSRKKEKKVYAALSYLLFFAVMISAGVFAAGMLYFIFKTDFWWTLAASFAVAALAAWDLIRIARRARK
jgi:hypothetical protein